MATIKELRELYLSINEQNEHHALIFLSRHLKNEYCLLDEEGFTISIYYERANAAAYYENRKTGTSFLDFIGVTDARLELLVFFARVMQLFSHDLSPFDTKMVLETDSLFQKFEIQ